MSEENRNFTYKHFISALLIIGFGWGALWTGAKGAQIAFGGRDYHVYTSHLMASLREILEPNPIYKNNSKDTATVANTDVSENIPVAIPANSTVTVLIGGDVMLDRSVRALGEKNSYESLFSGVMSVFKTADIVAVNLEGPITSSSSRTLLPNGKTTKKLSFTFATTTAVALANVGIDLVSLANNHTDNFGSKGFLETKKWLTDAGVQYFGDPWNSSSTEAIITKNGISVAFVGYHAFQSGLTRTMSDIVRLSDKVDFVIVMPHWGEEYVATTSPKLRTLAQTMISAGADAIIGSHPHIIMENEFINGVPVFYSLGNLLFDQYFSPEVMKGNLVELKIVKDSSGIKLTGIRTYETSTESRMGVTITSGPTSVETQ